MARSTVKEKNVILDELKKAVDLKSRKAAEIYLYDVVAKAFKREGASLSHYLNGRFSVTLDHAKYYYVNVDDLFTPKLTVDRIKKEAA